MRCYYPGFNATSTTPPFILNCHEWRPCRVVCWNIQFIIVPTLPLPLLLPITISFGRNMIINPPCMATVAEKFEVTPMQVIGPEFPEKILLPFQWTIFLQQTIQCNLSSNQTTRRHSWTSHFLSTDQCTSCGSDHSYLPSSKSLLSTHHGCSRRRQEQSHHPCRSQDP